MTESLVCVSPELNKLLTQIKDGYLSPRFGKKKAETIMFRLLS